MSVEVVVVGAGLAGMACARELVEAGVAVRVLDRGHTVGGRMASRRLDGRPVDLGASYLTVDDPDFETVVRDWERRGLARRWTDTFDVIEAGGERRTTTGPVRWGAPGGLRSLVEDLAAGLPEGTIERADLAGPSDLPEADAVVLAMPDPQARRLLPEDHPLLDELDREWEPVLALAARWAEPGWGFDGAFVNDHDVLAWVADDGRRRGDDAPVLVAHSTPQFARPHLADPQAATGPMAAALRDLLGLGAPVSTHLHRWTFARPTGERADRHVLLAHEGAFFGACGDGWGPTSKVETAWLSGRELGRLIGRMATM